MARTAEHFSTLHEFSVQGVRLSRINKRTESGRQEYAKAIDRVRRGFIGSNTTLVQNALERTITEAVDQARHAGVPQRMPNMIQATLQGDPSIYRQAIERIYIRLFLTFAPQILDEFRPKALKDEEPDGGPGSLTDQEWARFTNMARTYVEKNGGVLIQEPHRTTKRMMMEASRDAVEEGLRKGWGTDRVADKIIENSKPAMSKVRGRRIARTETLRASNAGMHETARSLNTNLWKEWVAILDLRTRGTHVSADGQRVLIDNKFMVGGYLAQYPNDPNLPPGESINCRCVVVFLNARQGATQN